MKQQPYLERTDGWLLRWRVVYPTEGMGLESLHLTRVGARWAVILDRA